MAYSRAVPQPAPDRTLGQPSVAELNPTPCSLRSHAPPKRGRARLPCVAYVNMQVKNSGSGDRR